MGAEEVMPSNVSQNPDKILRSKPGVRAVSICIYLIGIAFWTYYVPEKFRAVAAAIYGVLGALWLADLFMTRIVLRADGVLICSLFRTHVYPRAEVEEVTWEKGCGASIKLRDGKWVRLPNTGDSPQGQTNTIRAWIRRTDA